MSSIEKTDYQQFFDIIVVNNAAKNLEIDLSKFSDLTVIHERNVGLSYARNAGLQKSDSKWLLFLDDDAKLKMGSLQEIFGMINQDDFDMFTGIWTEWFVNTPPKWLPHSTGNYILKGEHKIREIRDDYVSGGIMIINRQKLLEIGGFPTHLGMTGNKVAYGDETWVENEFKKRGWSVGINPYIVIEHLVGEHKYKLRWHLEAQYAKGRDTYAIHGGNKISIFLGLIVRVLFGWIKPLVKLCIRKKFYIQNFIIDYIGSVLYKWGAITS